MNIRSALMAANLEMKDITSIIFKGLFSIVLMGPLFVPEPEVYSAMVWAILGVALIIEWGRYKTQYGLNLFKDLFSSSLLPLILLACWSLCSIGWSEGIDKSVTFIWLLFCWAAVFAFIFFIASMKRQRAELINLLLMVSLLAALVALFSLVWQFWVLERPLSYRGFRIASSGFGEFANLRNPIDAGLYYGVFATVLVFYLCMGRRIIFRRLCVLSLMPMLAYLVLTYSRGAMFSLVAASAVIAVLSGKRGWVCFAVLAAVTGMLLGFGEMVLEAELDKGFNGREPIWLHAMELIQQAPLAGHGAGQVFNYVIPPEITYHFAHNYFLTLWNHYGLVGVLLFPWLLIRVALFCFLRRKHSLNEEGFFILVLGLLTFGFVGIQSYVDEMIRQPHPYWLLIWLPVGMTMPCGYRRKAVHV